METNSARAEARHLKAQLDECLGLKAERYWKLCREFHTENTLTKRTFDESVSTLLKDVAISVSDMTVSDEKGRSGMDISTKDSGGDAQHPDVCKENTEEEEGSMVDGRALHNRFVMAVLKSAQISQQNYRKRATDMQEASKRRLLDNSSKTVLEPNDATKGSCKKRRRMSQGESTAGASPLRIRLPFTPATGHKSEDFSSAIPHTGLNGATSASSRGSGKSIASDSGSSNKTGAEVKRTKSSLSTHKNGTNGGASATKGTILAGTADASSVGSIKSSPQSQHIKPEPATTSLDNRGAKQLGLSHTAGSGGTGRQASTDTSRRDQDCLPGNGTAAAITSTNTSSVGGLGTSASSDLSTALSTVPLATASPAPPTPESTTNTTMPTKSGGKRKKPANKQIGGKGGGKGSANKQMGGKGGTGKQVSGKGGGKGSSPSGAQAGSKSAGKCSGKQGNQNAKHKDKDKGKGKEAEIIGSTRDSIVSSISASTIQRPVCDRESFVMAAEPFGPVADAGGRFVSVPVKNSLIDILKPEKRVTTSEASLLEALHTKDGFVTLRDSLPKRSQASNLGLDEADTTITNSTLNTSTLPSATVSRNGSSSTLSPNVPPKGNPSDSSNKQPRPQDATIIPGKGTNANSAVISISKTKKEGEQPNGSADEITQQEVLEMLTNKGHIPAPWQDQADAQLAYKYAQITAAEGKVTERLAGNPRSLAPAISALERERERARLMERDRKQAIQDEKDELLLCTDTLVIPGRGSKALIKRMQAMAVQNGLAGGCDDAAFGVMADAVRTHLKTIMRSCLSLKVKAMNDIGVSRMERLYRPARCARAFTRSSYAEKGGATGSMEDVSAAFNSTDLGGTSGLGGIGVDDMGLVGNMSDVGLGLDLSDVSMGGFDMETINMGLGMGLGMVLGMGIEPNAGLNMGVSGMGLSNMGLGDMGTFNGVGMGVGLGRINAYGGVDVGLTNNLSHMSNTGSLSALDGLVSIPGQGLGAMNNPSKSSGGSGLQVGLDGGFVGMNFSSDYMNTNNPLPVNGSNDTMYMSILGDGQMGNLRLSGTTNTSMSGLNTNYDSPASSTSPVPPSNMPTKSPQTSLLSLGGVGESNLDTIRNMSAAMQMNSTNINLSTSRDNRGKALRHASTQPSIFADGSALDGLTYGTPSADTSRVISRMGSLNLQRSNSMSLTTAMRLNPGSIGNTVTTPAERALSSFGSAVVGGFELSEGLRFDSIKSATGTVTSTGVNNADGNLTTAAGVGFQSQSPMLDLGRISMSGSTNPSTLGLASTAGYFHSPNPPSPNQFKSTNNIGTGNVTSLGVSMPGSNHPDNTTLFSPTPSSTSANSGGAGVINSGLKKNTTMGYKNSSIIAGIAQTPTNTPNSEEVKNNDDERNSEGWGRLQPVGPICLEDLLSTFQVYPHLRGDNQLSCERLLSQLWQV